MLSAADVRSARFTATKFRSGYEITEVDELLARSVRTLEHLEQGLTVESDGTPLLTPNDLLTARFSPTELTEGYFVDEVDDLLDGIIDTLNTYIGRAERGEPLVQPDDAAGDDSGDAAAQAPGEPADEAYVADAPLDEAPLDAVPADVAPLDESSIPEEPVSDEPVADVFEAADLTASEPQDAPDADTGSLDAWAAALQEHAPAEEPLVTSEATPADSFEAPSEPLAPADADPFAVADAFPAAPVWSPPASTDVTPSAWGAPVEDALDDAAPVEEAADEDAPVEDAVTEDSPLDAATEVPADTIWGAPTDAAVTEDTPLEAPTEAPAHEDAPTPLDEPLGVPVEEVDFASVASIEADTADGSDELPVVDDVVGEAAESVGDDWSQPADHTSPWSPPEPVRWAAPAADDVAEVAAEGDAEVAAEDEALAAEDGSAAEPVAEDAVAAEAVAEEAASEGLAPWEPGFVPPANPITTPDWGFSAPAAAETDEWSDAAAEPADADATAPLLATPVEPVEDATDNGSLLASTDESPWASLDGDEPVALDLDAEVRDAESTDAELPAWLTDAQPEMAAPLEPAVDEPVLAEPVAAEPDAEPAAEAPTRVSAFAFAAQPTDDPDLDAPTILMEAVQEPAPVEADAAAVDAPAIITSAPVAAPTFDAPEASFEPVDAPADAPAVAEPEPYVAPAEALDSQGFLRQLTFARATSTGAAKDAITLVGPDGKVFSAVNVRKTPDGLVVDLG
ncbi:DivIVA domain-containing protein [Sanguibacter sp. HDW7]|uniref:DivIVA domain-containing protein n=1 Tax=Sanguibacter sp. HDW7 TaxID=2714931 RepID=UPI00140CC4A1|nr:DivIVA domain-containing protein [Sanguibacter sp. HDW7]QIK82257.1 DivIVA domain-containing protein [Sanguibacter sp. HDW7]